jgi:hypothetical protein
MLLLGFAAIPIVGMVWTNATEADLANSYLFAQNLARNAMNATLDTVPFDALQVSTSKIADLDGGNPEEYVGRLSKRVSFDAAGFLALLGNKGIDTYTRGEIKDERGLTYRVKLFVYPVPIMDAVDLEREISFSYLPRPPFENSVNSSNRPAWFTGDPFVSREVTQLPYDMSVATQTKNARGVGAQPKDPDLAFAVMKKLLLRVRWKAPTGPERVLEIPSAKADITTRE